MNKELEEAKIRLYEFIHNINLADKTIENIKQDVYTVLNYIDNSIPKEVVEKKIEENKEYLKHADDMFEYTQKEVIQNVIKSLQELSTKKRPH